MLGMVVSGIRAGKVRNSTPASGVFPAKIPAMTIPQSFISELLSRVDVVEVVGRYVQLKKGGANFMGLCPFHGE
jgi:DNA primase